MSPDSLGRQLRTHGVAFGTEDPASDGAQPSGEFAGLGPWLEDPDPDVFKSVEELVRRQELLATNHWNQDEYYKCVVSGYPWATLVHDTGKDSYSFSLPYGVSLLSIQPVPNRNQEVVNSASEALLVDFPQIDCEPIDDSEEAENAAEMADRFLTQDAGEQGTNDQVLFDDRVKLSLMTATSYVELWVDPVGGGYIPLQVKAHPQAESPDNPLVGPDQMPTTDYILRYVGNGQFVDDPTQADPQWQPKIRASKWGREHVRVFPENASIEHAEKVIILGYCTLGEAKRRWESVGKMAPEDLSALCDWTPSITPSYLFLLPPFMRPRWKLTDGKQKNKGGSSDERIMFYYHVLQTPTPDYPKGADVVVTGALDAMVLDRQLLSTEVEVNKGQGKVKETRCRTLPLVAITPRGDPRGQDPSGLAYVEMFVGATEWNAMLAQHYGHAMQKILTNPYVVSATSPIKGRNVQAARESEDMLLVVDMQRDMPQQLPPPPLPAAFFEMFGLSNEAVDRIANTTKAATGELTGAQEHSGKAISLAIGQNNIGIQSRLNAVNNAYSRFCRIKCELVMSKYTTPQQLNYVGEDGAAKQDEFSGVDFALVGKVNIKTGTGTGQAQDQKVNTLGTLAAEGFISRAEAAESARPILARRMGLPANPYEQYVERCVDSWLKGPPQPPEPDPTQPPQVDPATGQAIQPPSWEQEYQAWMTAQQQYEQQQAQFTAQQQQYQQFLTLQAQLRAGAPSGALGPEQQDEKARLDYANAGIQLQVMQAQNPAIGQPPIAPQPPQLPKPWTPFEDRPIDTLPDVAGIWVRKLGKLISSVKYDAFGSEWQDVLTRRFTEMRQASATASGAAPQTPPQGQQPTQPTPPTQPHQAQSPSPRAA